MLARVAVVAAALVLGIVAPARADEAAPVAEPKVAVVDATAKLGADTGQLAKIKRVLDARGMLQELPESVQAALEGRRMQFDNDRIRAAYANGDYDAVAQLVDEHEARILQAAGSGDPVPALVALYAWRALAAFGRDQPEEVTRWLRAVHRLDPAWTLDPSYSVAALERLIKKAKREPDEVGTLRIDADPEGALVSIDGRKPQPARERPELAIGPHLVVVSADGRTAFAEVVMIEAGQVHKLALTLDKQTKSERVARAVDAAVSAPAGRARLDRVKQLVRFTTTAMFLVVEDAQRDRLVVRFYDAGKSRISAQLDVESGASNAMIYRQLRGALDFETPVGGGDGGSASRRWYERWYVWVGIGAVIGGGVIGYQYATREPTAIRGF